MLLFVNFGVAMQLEIRHGLSAAAHWQRLGTGMSELVLVTGLEQTMTPIVCPGRDCTRSPPGWQPSLSGTVDFSASQGELEFTQIEHWEYRR